MKPAPRTDDRSQVALGVLVFVLILFIVLCAVFAVKYAEQRHAIEQACSQTGAAAKLDLSSFVPICGRK